MIHAGEQYAQQIEVARAAIGRGDRAAAVEALSAAVAATREEATLHREHVAALVRLGALERELGRWTESEFHLTEAITASERIFGSDHPSLAAALNELSRLHIRQSDYARAEPVLKRLLQIARAKGDRHADVATALAGLAAAKRGLGENAAAEVLYRHALRIREEVLAPDHMAIVITLEQLAETCATRGNFGEALAHLHRALPTREAALGSDHATVHGLRDRITDLQRRIARSTPRAAERPAAPPRAPTEVRAAPVVPPVPGDTPLRPSAPAAASSDRRATPARTRSVSSTAQASRSSDLVFLYQPEPPPRISRPAARMATPARAVVVPAPVADAAALVPPVQSVALERIPSPAAGVVLVQPSPVAIGPVRELADAPAIEADSRDLATIWSSVKRATSYASAGAAIVVLAMVGSNFGTPDASETERAPSASVVEAPSVVAPVPAAKSRAASAPASDAASRGAAAAAAATAQPSRSSEAPAATPSAPTAPSIRRLVMPKVAVPSVDSLMRTVTRVARDADWEPNAAGSLLASTRDDDTRVTPPVLIGPAPAPRFPEELRSRGLESEVIVRFRVDEKGRVETKSMQVVQSGHELFTTAVRNVLPRLRFEPARTAAPESKPQAAWVQFRAEFSARN